MEIENMIDFNTLFLSLCFYIFVDYIHSSNHLDLFLQNK